MNDAESLLNNYHELLGILKLTKDHKLEKVSEALEILNNKANEFLNTYDKPGGNGEKNGVVDVLELIALEARKELVQDFGKEKPEGGGSQLGDIVQAITKLEEEIRKYRQGFYYGISEIEIVDKEVEKQQLNNELVNEKQVMNEQVATRTVEEKNLILQVANQVQQLVSECYAKRKCLPCLL